NEPPEGASPSVAVTVIAPFTGSPASDESTTVEPIESNVRERTLEAVLGCALLVKVEAFTTHEKSPCALGVSVHDHEVPAPPKPEPAAFVGVTAAEVNVPPSGAAESVAVTVMAPLTGSPARELRVIVGPAGSGTKPSAEP